MEENAAEFLKKIIKTISMGILWLLTIMTMGIYNGWMFFGDAPTLGNYIFYGFMLISLVGLIYYFYKIWKH